MKPIPSILALAVLAGPCTAALPEGDPFTTAPQETADEPVQKAPEWSIIEICYEAFSLSLADAAALKREALADPALYQRILELIEADKAKQETFTVTRTMSGQKATTVAVLEQYFPTELAKPELPNSVSIQVDESPTGTAAATNPVPDQPARPHAATKLATPATPSSFRIRNTGFTFEIEATTDANNSLIDLRVTPEHVVKVDDCLNGQGLSETRMPQFETQMIRTAVTLKPGVPRLLGTISRPPVSKADENSANTTWFAFVTGRFIVQPPL